MVILLLQITSLNSSGQSNSFRFTNINAGNGLPENQCRFIYQDIRGLIWIGTVNGLVRYDGINFVSFKNDVFDITSLSNNTVKAILEDKYHQLWIGTEEGLNLYKPEQNNFIIFKNNPQNTQSLSNDNVNSLYLDERGNFWVCTENGLNLLNYKDKTFTQFIEDNNNRDILPGENIEKVCDANSGKLWVASNRGLGLFDPARSKSVNYRLGNSSSNLSEWIDDILVDKKNRLWIAVSNGGLYRVDDVKTFKYVHYVNHPFDNKSLLDNYVIRINEDHESNIWIGTYEGLNLFDEKNNGFIRFIHDDLNEYSLSGRFVFSVFEDNQQSLWIPTFRGISYYSKYQNQFNLLQNSLKNRTSTISNEVRSIYRTKNNELLVGYIIKGFEVYDKNNRLIEHYEHDPNVEASVINNNINAILEDNDKKIWIGTLGGLSLFNRNTKTFRNFTFDPDDTTSLGNNGVFAIYQDSHKHLWVCTWGGGLNLYDGSKNRFIRYFTSIPFTEADKFVKTIIEAHDGTFWIGNNDGLKIFDKKKNSLKYFRHSISDRSSLSSNYIQAIFEDSKNRLWIATTTGLNIMTDPKGSFKAYTEKDGLPSNIIYGILEDKLGRLWLSTSNGLCCFTPPTDGREAIFRNYVKDDGIQDNQFAEGSYFFDKRNGEMFFGGNNGLTYFIPEKISDNPYKPDIILTRLLLSNKPVRIGEPGSPLKVEFNQTKELVLNNSQASVFTIEFSALNYINPQKNQFSYMLEGFDKEWNFIGNKSSVTYTNLGHGEYYFKIKAANNHAVWNEIPRVLKITILPPWWKTTWAIIIYVLIINGILLLLRNYSLSRARLKHSIMIEKIEKEKAIELNDLKLQFFTNVSHEFKTPLTLILAPIEELVRDESISVSGKKHLTIIQKNAIRLYRLINQLLEFRKVESEVVEIKAIQTDIIKEINQIRLAFDDFANKYNINLEIKSTLNSCLIWLDRDKFEKILYNLLSNAFKYTPEYGSVKIYVDKVTKNSDYSGSFLRNLKSSIKLRDGNQEFISIAIEDTGMGIENEEIFKIFNKYYKKSSGISAPVILKETSTGIGLSLVKALVELQSGSISVTSEKGKGTKFTVLLPLDNKHLREDQMIKDDSNLLVEEEFASLQKFEDELKATHSDHKLLAIDSDHRNQYLILLVEDNIEFRNFLKDELSAEYKIAEASNGEEGFEMALKSMPDLIITDIMMPKLDGMELCKKLKSEIKTSHISIIILSAKNMIKDVIEGLDLGVIDYVGKPFSINYLKARIKNTIDTNRRMREFFAKGKIDVSMPEFKLNKHDENFLKQAYEIVEKNISDPDLGVEAFCKFMSMNHMQVYRKLKSLVNQSPNEFIRNFRLDKASKLLQENDLNVSEVAYDVGFIDPLYFSRCFKKRFGLSPTFYNKRFK